MTYGHMGHIKSGKFLGLKTGSIGGFGGGLLAAANPNDHASESGHAASQYDGGDDHQVVGMAHDHGEQLLGAANPMADDHHEHTMHRHPLEEQMNEQSYMQMGRASGANDMPMPDPMQHPSMANLEMYRHSAVDSHGMPMSGPMDNQHMNDDGMAQMARYASPNDMPTTYAGHNLQQQWTSGLERAQMYGHGQMQDDNMEQNNRAMYRRSADPYNTPMNYHQSVYAQHMARHAQEAQDHHDHLVGATGLNSGLAYQSGMDHEGHGMIGASAHQQTVFFF